jgi:hypothetical protein
VTKLDDMQIRTQDRALRELLSTIVTYWNGGKYSFKEISATPTDSPSDPEMRVSDSGADVVKLYVYAPSSAKWFWTANMSSA